MAEQCPSLARLQKLMEIIEKTPPYLRAVTLSLRGVWQLKTKQIPALTKFREDFLKDASVLKKFLVPFTLAVVTGLDRLFDEYVKCDFATWNGVISDIGDIALEYERLCYCLLEWYEHILEDLKKLPDLVAAFAAEVPPEILQCQQMARIQYVKHNISDGTFVSLLFIPEVGEIVAPLMVNAGVAKRGSVEPTIVHGPFEVAAGAVLSTKETLVPAVAKVMSNLRFIHNVFEEFTKELEGLIGEDTEEQEKDYKKEERQAHYEHVRVQAFHLQKKCRYIHQISAHFETDCDEVPSYLVPDYPREWVDEKRDKNDYDLSDMVVDSTNNVELHDLLEPPGT